MRIPQAILKIAVLASSVALGAMACATGDSLSGLEGGDESSSDSSTATTGSAGGGDTTATTTGATTSASTSATSGSGGAPPMCEDDPCKVTLPQCGCNAGEQCSVSAAGVTCVPEGTIGWGEACGGVGDCEPGYLCILKKDTPPTVSTCAKFCDSDNECQSPGGLCTFGLNDGNGGTIPGVTICSENCDLVTNTGCPVSGTSCQLAQEPSGLKRFFTYCNGAGAGTQNSTCLDGTECAVQYGCFNTGGASDVCLKWCNVNSPSCSGATSCVGLTDANGNPVVIGAITYGACL